MCDIAESGRGYPGADPAYSNGCISPCRLHLDAHDHLTAKIAELDALVQNPRDITGFKPHKEASSSSRLLGCKRSNDQL